MLVEKALTAASHVGAWKRRQLDDWHEIINCTLLGATSRTVHTTGS